MDRLTEKSKYMSYLLRHKPEDGNIELDVQGYTDVLSLLKALDITSSELDEIVDTDSKGRYSYNEDHTRIRANQGHSVDYVHIDFKEYESNEVVYHGTSSKYRESILREGLIPKSRQYVHLSKDLETATNVGKRHVGDYDAVIVYVINVPLMKADGYKFYESDNGVVLTKSVPPKYINLTRISY
jgi:putative RNA 2'-phosphotransferase